MINKNEIREKNKLLRKEMAKEEVIKKSISASERLLDSELYKKADIIMLYMPIGNEADTSYIMKKALEDEKKIAFPVTDRESGTITPVLYDGTGFYMGAYGISEPNGEDVVSLSPNDIIIIPGVAYDRSGERVGFGKGCYDKFLKSTKAIKIGFCYEFQVVDKIDADAHDVSMNCIATEKEMIVIE